jgi:hypothetical protein
VTRTADGIEANAHGVRTPGCREGGQGLISTLFGFVVVMVLLLLVVQVSFDLYARSLVTATAVEAARSVADYDSSQNYPTTQGAAVDGAEQTALAVAQSRAAGELGGYAKVARFTFDPSTLNGSPPEVTLTVSFDISRSSFNLTGPLALPLLNHFTRTVRVRVEHITCPAGLPCTVASGQAPAVDPAAGPPGTPDGS